MASFVRKGQDECWPWIGTKNEQGYGSFWFGRHGIPKGKVVAHRVMFQLRYGPIPKGLLACHKCDNPECVNPRHIFLGTHQDNTDDRERKGRCKNKGEDHWSSTLTESQVIKIRELSLAGRTGRSLAKQFSVTPGTICNILKGKTHRRSLPIAV